MWVVMGLSWGRLKCERKGKSKTLTHAFQREARYTFPDSSKDIGAIQTIYLLTYLSSLFQGNSPGGTTV